LCSGVLDTAHHKPECRRSSSHSRNLRRHSRSSPLTASHPSRPLPTPGGTGSSPVAPTIHGKQIQTEGSVGGSGCDLRSQFAFLQRKLVQYSRSICPPL